MKTDYKIGLFLILCGIITFVYFQSKISGWGWLDEWEMFYLRLSWVSMFSVLMGIFCFVKGFLTKMHETGDDI